MKPARRRSAGRPSSPPACSTQCSASRASSSRCTTPPGSAIAFLAYVFVGLYLSMLLSLPALPGDPVPRRKDAPALSARRRRGDITSAAARIAAARTARSATSSPSSICISSRRTLFRYRLLDLNELLGRMVVLGTLVLILTPIYGVLVGWVGPDEHGLFFFNTLLASFAIAILLEPLRGRVEGQIKSWMFQEKYELTRAHRQPARRPGQRHRHARAVRTRAGGAGGIAPDHPRVDLPGRSRRLGLRAARATSGPRPEERFDAVTHRAFFERICGAPASSRWRGWSASIAARRTVSTEERESLQLMPRTLEQMNGSVALGFNGEDQLLGALVLRDERLREAYSPDEIDLFRGVATQIGVTLQNSQVYERMKERDRLAALGEMAAGLAHEIRNPLGVDQGRGAAAAAGRRRPRRRDNTARIPRHHRRGGQPPQQDRVAVPRLRAPLPRRAAAARGQRGGAQDAAAAGQGAGAARRRDRHRTSPRGCRRCAPTPSSCCRSS